MSAPLNSLIQPMYFDLIKASMASLLLNEQVNQEALAVADGKTATEIDNGYFFNVFKDKYRLPDASYLPAVNIRNMDWSYGEGMSDSILSSKWCTYRVSIECYSVSCAEPDEAADKLAADRLDYLWAQVFQTFESEANFDKGLSAIVKRAKFTSAEQNQYEVGVSNSDTAQIILAIQGIYELQFDEPTEMITGDDFEMLVASLEIDDQFISPFVTINK